MEAGFYARTTQHIHFPTLQHFINDETLINNMKQSTQPRGKRENKEREPQVRAKSTQIQRGSQRGKGVNYYVPKPLQKLQETYQRKLENIVKLRRTLTWNDDGPHSFMLKIK
jgi:hypothetical protein